MPPTSTSLQFAQQLHQSLLRELGHEIKIERLVSDARYARDVLLVCDAYPGTELASLAAQFRALAANGPAAGAPAPTAEATRTDSGAVVSRPSPLITSPVAMAPAAPALTESEEGTLGQPAPHNPDDDWTEVVAKPPRRKWWLARWRSS